MGRNTGSGYRIGSVRDREQTPTSIGYVKRQPSTGKVIDVKSTPWKGVAMNEDGRLKMHK